MSLAYKTWFLAVVIPVAGLAIAACGDDVDTGGAQGAIQTDKGLAVAALASAETADEGVGAGAPLEAGTVRQGAGAQAAGGDPARAQFLQSNDGISVQGYGSASTAAEGALLELQIYRDPNAPLESPKPGQPYPSPRPPNEAEVQPLIDAIIAAGVASEDVQFIEQPLAVAYSTTSTTVRVTVRNIGSFDPVVKAATDATTDSVVRLGGINVSYTVNDCAALEEAAMRAAVEDANERAAVFGRALGVGIGSVTGASNYSYFGSTPCDPGVYPGSYPLTGVTYAEGQPREVQVIANISVTFAIQ